MILLINEMSSVSVVHLLSLTAVRRSFGRVEMRVEALESELHR